MKNTLSTLTLSIVTLFIVFTNFCNPRPVAEKNITLFGSVKCLTSIEDLAGLPISFKGNDYDIKVEKKADSTKAEFELYDDTKSSCIYILFTEYLKQPE